MKKIHDFDEPVDRIGTDSYKWDCEGAGGKYIPLGVADTDFRAPEEVCAAVRKRVDFGVFAYGNLPQKRFTDAVCAWYKKRYGLTLDPQGSAPFAGTHDGRTVDDSQCLYPSGRQNSCAAAGV